MSERSQKVLVWWAIISAVIYGAAFAFLLHMVPPPSPKLTELQIAHWYAHRHTDIRVGAIISSWTSAFMLPLSIVVAVQMARQEGGSKVWSVLTVASGSMLSIFFVLPPLFFGVAAYTTHQAPSATAIMHHLGVLTFITTDQYYIFMWVALTVVCLLPRTARYSPFPRWFGYFNAWTAFMFEAGAIAFLPRTGPFDWRGFFPFWSALILFGLWFAVICYLLLSNLTKQRQGGAEPEAITSPPLGAAPTSTTRRAA